MSHPSFVSLLCNSFALFTAFGASFFEPHTDCFICSWDPGISSSVPSSLAPSLPSSRFPGQVQSVDGSDASIEAADDERRGVFVLQTLGRKCSDSDSVDGNASCQTKVRQEDYNNPVKEEDDEDSSPSEETSFFPFGCLSRQRDLITTSTTRTTSSIDRKEGEEA